MLMLLSLSTLAEAELNEIAAEKVAVIDNMHAKAEKAIVNAAKNKAFPDFFRTHDHNEKSRLKTKIERISLAVQREFSVEEMCLIDANGPELTRIVNRKIATDLSPDESGAIFFAPGIKLKENESYVSPVYYSPDALRLVIAYLTPIILRDKNVAMLHFEHDLKVYQEELSSNLKDGTELLAVNKEGYIVSDSRSDIKIYGDKENVGDYLKLLKAEGMNMVDIKNAIDSGNKFTLSGISYSGVYKDSGHWTYLILSSI